MTARAQVVLLVALAVHAIVVLSIVDSPRPVIWPLHNDTIHRIGPAADFYAVYHAGVNMRRGLSPFANNADGVTPPFYPFRYLPGLALAAEPLTWLAPERAYLVWVVVLEALLAWLIVSLRAHVAERRWVGLAVVLLLSSPYFLELYMGQFTFAAVACCAIALVAGRGWLFAAGSALKAFPIVALPAFLRRPRERSVVVWTAAAVLVCTVPFFIARPPDYQRFVAVNLNPGGALDSGNYSSLMVLYLAARDLDARWLLTHWAAAVGWLRIAVIAATVLLVVFKDPPPALGASALLLAHFATYQHIWEHSVSGVVVIAAVLAMLPVRSSHEDRILWACLIVCALPTPFALFDAKDPRMGDPTVTWPRYAWYLIVLAKALPTVGLLAWSVRRIARDCGDRS
jgi:glycosyl transferase family 87